MESQTPIGKRSYLSKEESFMYDREKRFPMEETMNAARIEFAEKGVTNLAARRCDLIQVSKSSALIAINIQFSLPRQFYLDVPDARIARIGCVLMKTFANNTAEVRFLSLLNDKDLDKIFVYSTHPKHRNRVLDIRAR
ncbi:hypothetical protein JJB09_24900 [Rhizobium sp. KVB221]|uniref:Uncharacterized protein n=1 Tax=Rhizobium setariae TaxID=2801340 RepID=A0A936YSZ3_9HYPH|nr:hypothetical protein [Rhizobium setariae]MBL0375258.1 hypothetical protein [Rhizobium setariae]